MQDDWEIVEKTADCQAAEQVPRKLTMSVVDLPPAREALTRKSKLLDLSKEELQQELSIRGIAYQEEASQRQLAGQLFMVLPAPYEKAWAPAPLAQPVVSKQVDMPSAPLAPSAPPAASASAPCEAQAAQPVSLYPSAPELAALGSEAPKTPAPAAVGSDAQYSAPIPDDFKCPITCDIMVNPVVTADGFSYEEAAITEWLSKHNTSPLVGCMVWRLYLTCLTRLELSSRTWTCFQTCNYALSSCCGVKSI